MFDYFRRWKRKAGLVTLVMGCAFTAMWVRSQYKCDNLCRVSAGSRDVITSVDGRLSLDRMTRSVPPFNETGYFRLFGDEYYWLARDISSVGGFELDAQGKRPAYEPFHSGFNVEWCWEWAGFTFGAAMRKPELARVFHADLYSVPYWAIVVPLTLLSAYLLLTKSRTKGAQTEPSDG